MYSRDAIFYICAGCRLSRWLNQDNRCEKPFRKDYDFNGGVGLLVHVKKNGIIAKRREDIETNNISCIWIEITPEKGVGFSGKFISTSRFENRIQ